MRTGLVLDCCEYFADLGLDLLTELYIVCEEGLNSLATLCELAFSVAEP